MPPKRKATDAGDGQPKAKKPRTSTPKTKKPKETRPKRSARSSKNSEKTTAIIGQENPTLEQPLDSAERPPVPGTFERQREEPGDHHELGQALRDEEHSRLPGQLGEAAERPPPRPLSPAISIVDHGHLSELSAIADDELRDDIDQAPERRRGTSYEATRDGRTSVSVERNVPASTCDNNAIDRLANVLEATLSSFQNNSLSERSTFLLSRLTTAKTLPTFSGDPLEWLYFKKTYEVTTESGGYSDQENVARLFKSLKGNARDAVSSLLATGRDAAAIIKTLELHFGNKHVIARKLADDIKMLPDLESGKMKLTQFAAKLKNAVSAFRALGLTGYLHSVDLIRSVARKLPSVLKYNYNRYAARAFGEETELEKLSDFLYTEAELAVAGGLFDLEPEGRTTRTTSDRRGVASEKHGKVYTAACEPGRDLQTVNKPLESNTCLYCERFGHALDKCRAFTKESVNRRWFLVKKWRVCFKCLKIGHLWTNCNSEKCSKCRREHHDILHDPARMGMRKGPTTVPPQKTVHTATRYHSDVASTSAKKD